MDGEVRVLVTGRGLVEAPRWHGGRLYFSDWTAGEVIAVDPAGHTEVVAELFAEHHEPRRHRPTPPVTIGLLQGRVSAWIAFLSSSR